MNKIELVLKSPTDRVAPFSVIFDNLCSIKQLKIHIQDVYPCKPKVESQKLIYSGKLLKDDQVLKDIFENDTSAIVHFICQPSIPLDNDLQKKNDANQQNTELYQQYQDYLKNFYNSPTQSVSNMEQFHQMMWLNQAYMQSYATYYSQWNNKPDNCVQTATYPEVIQRTIVNEATNQENPPNNDRPIEVAGDNGMQNMMAAAFGGLMGDGGEDENDADAEPRDLLHYFYMFVRFGLLLLICYYYSSMASVVTTLMLFFLFFGVNIFRRNNRLNIPVVAPVPETIVEPSAPLDDNQDSAGINTADNETESPAAVEALPGISGQLRHVANTSLQFVLTFFVTLFPDPVGPIDVN